MLEVEWNHLKPFNVYKPNDHFDNFLFHVATTARHIRLFFVNNTAKKSATRGKNQNTNTTIRIYWTLMLSRTIFGTPSFSAYLRYDSSDVLIGYRLQTCKRRVIPSCFALVLPLTLHDGRRHDTSAVSSASAFHVDQTCAERFACSLLFMSRQFHTMVIIITFTTTIFRTNV